MNNLPVYTYIEYIKYTPNASKMLLYRKLDDYIIILLVLEVIKQRRHKRVKNSDKILEFFVGMIKCFVITVEVNIES